VEYIVKNSSRQPNWTFLGRLSTTACTAASV
jgi:hypothetical protein